MGKANPKHQQRKRIVERTEKKESNFTKSYHLGKKGKIGLFIFAIMALSLVVTIVLRNMGTNDKTLVEDGFYVKIEYRVWVANETGVDSLYYLADSPDANGIVSFQMNETYGGCLILEDSNPTYGLPYGIYTRFLDSKFAAGDKFNLPLIASVDADNDFIDDVRIDQDVEGYTLNSTKTAFLHNRNVYFEITILEISEVPFDADEEEEEA